MKFHELLNQYMTTLHCTGNELSARCGLSASVISRYRSGEREPQPDSDSLATLANALADLAKEQGMDQLSAANILSAFQDALLSKSKEYDLFFYMLSNRNIALSRDKLISEVWGYDFYGDARTLDTHVKLLRKSLGRYAGMIVTLRGVGYRFEG